MPDKAIACRCEDVGVHELEKAIALGHRDLESIKRYTGLGTGWCQGKQCAALCCRLIERLGGDVPTEPITPRPPYHPLSLAELARLAELPEQEDRT